MIPYGVSFVDTLVHTLPCMTSSMGYLLASNPPNKNVQKKIQIIHLILIGHPKDKISSTLREIKHFKIKLIRLSKLILALIKVE
jgi:hypothetical protein